jgi:hypothetical protein
MDKCVLKDQMTGSAFLNLPNLLKHPEHWFHIPHLANPVLANLVRWVDSSSYPPSIGSLSKVQEDIIASYYGDRIDSFNINGNDKEFRTISIGKTLVTAPRPGRNGNGNWIFLRSPPMSNQRVKHRTKVARNQTILFDDRFFVTIMPQSHAGKGSDINLTSFYKTLEPHVPKRQLINIAPADPSWDMSRNDQIVYSSSALSCAKEHDGYPYHLIIRHLDKEDEYALSNIFQRRHLHPAWFQFRRAWEHYKHKMPLVGRFAIPVIALRHTDYSLVADPITETLNRDGSHRSAKVHLTKAHVKSPLGSLVAIPCLEMNFLPDLVSWKIEHRSVMEPRN